MSDNDPGSGKLVRSHPVGMPSEPGPLAAYKGKKPPAPQWFEAAIATPAMMPINTAAPSPIAAQNHHCSTSSGSRSLAGSAGSSPISSTRRVSPVTTSKVTLATSCSRRTPVATCSPGDR